MGSARICFVEQLWKLEEKRLKVFLAHSECSIKRICHVPSLMALGLVCAIFQRLAESQPEVSGDTDLPVDEDVKFLSPNP